MKPKRTVESRRWFQQAYYDLKAAEWNLEGGFHNTVCFLAQQSAEKALKSLLFYLGLRRKAFFTHSIVEMIQEGQKKAPFLAEALISKAIIFPACSITASTSAPDLLLQNLKSL